jgi:hypothetical protein
MKYKSEFDILFENVLSAFGDDLSGNTSPEGDTSSDTPQLDSVEIQIVQGDSPTEITKKLDTQVKGLRKVASKNEDGGKIYYRTRNIVKLVDQLKAALGIVTAPEDEEEKPHFETPSTSETSQEPAI